MYGKGVSENGNCVSEDEMSTTALLESKAWHDALMDAEFRGRGDREKSVRGRLAAKTGIPESYLYRLAYKTAEMRDVAGSAYRALMIHYNAMCERNEAAADRYAAEREGLRANHEATDEKLVSKTEGVGAPEA